MRILRVEDEEKVARFIAIGLKAERFAVVRSRAIEGAGLGLSIDQAICTAHGGSVSAKKNPAARMPFYRRATAGR